MCVGRDISTIHHCVFQQLREQQGNRMITRGSLRQIYAWTDRQIRRICQSDPYITASELKCHIQSTGGPAVSTHEGTCTISSYKPDDQRPVFHSHQAATLKSYHGVHSGRVEAGIEKYRFH